jgi:hypothetical protein
MKRITLVLATALALAGVSLVQAHDGSRGSNGRGNDHGRYQSRGYAGYGNSYYRPVVVQRPRVIVVPAPRYSRYDNYRRYPSHGYGSYGSYGYDSYYGAPGYGWPGYVSSYPSGSLSLTLSLPLR